MRRAFPTEDLDYVIANTADVWRTLGGSRWFVTGGTGFIGSWLLEVIQRANELANAGIDVVVLSRSPARAIESAPHLFDSQNGISLVRGDVLDFEFDLGKIDVCIHAATDVADVARAADYQRVFDAGVVGTRRVLDAAVSGSAGRFLLLSSGAVYGKQPPELVRISEAYAGAPDPLDIRTAYGQSKRAAEWQAAAYSRADSLSVGIGRIFALLGPGLPLDGPFAAGNFIRDALRGAAIRVNDGNPVRSYLYVADACVWLLRILLNGATGMAYNVGSERAVSIADLANRIARLCGRDDSADDPVTGREVAAPPRYVPDTSRARMELGLIEHTSLEAALEKTINWNRMAAAA